LFVCLLGV